MPLNILLVDDHDLIRQGLRRVIEAEPDMAVVSEAATAAAALSCAAQALPQVTILDANLPDGSGLDLIPQLKTLRPDMGIVVLTMFDTDEHLFRALEAGASAFITKSAPSAGLIAAVRHAAAAPDTFSALELGAAMRRRLVAVAAPAITSTPAGGLTVREVQVMELLKLGHSVSQIAGQLYISVSTTKTHLAKIYEKLGATNRTQAVMQALRLGLISPVDEAFRVSS